MRLFKRTWSIMAKSLADEGYAERVTVRQAVKKVAWARNCQLTVSGYSPLEIATGRRPPDLFDVETSTPEQFSANPPEEDRTTLDLQRIAMYIYRYSLSSFCNFFFDSQDARSDPDDVRSDSHDAQSDSGWNLALILKVVAFSGFTSRSLYPRKHTFQRCLHGWCLSCPPDPEDKMPSTKSGAAQFPSTKKTVRSTKSIRGQVCRIGH